MVDVIKSKISNEEYKLMNDYLSDYVGYGCQDIYLTLDEWARKKSEYLFNLFGKELILEKEVSYEKSPFEIEDELIKNLEFAEMRSKIQQLIVANKEILFKKGISYYDLSELISWNSLAKNKLPELFCPVEVTNMANGKTFKLEAGMKTIKAIGKVCEALEANDLFEKFRILHSQVLNQKKLTGKLCISIHPMDYMTMSDNNNGWQSCMSWSHYGEYRLGTVEMMNSPYVVVGYLKSGTENFYDWNSKKWRSLYIVSEDFIANVKGYPFQSDSFDIEIINWLKELAIANCYENDYVGLEPKLYDYTRSTGQFSYRDGSEVISLGRRIAFRTNFMYNDFGSREGVWGIIIDKIPEYYERHFYYGGRAQCMHCGEITDSFDSSEYLMCYDCDPEQRLYCEECGERLYEDDAIWHGDACYCSYCFDELFEEDDITCDYTDVDSLAPLYIVDKEEDLGLQTFDNIWFKTEINYTVDTWGWSRLFKRGSKPKWSEEHNEYYMLIEDVNDFNMSFMSRARDSWTYNSIEDYYKTLMEARINEGVYEGAFDEEEDD